MSAFARTQHVDAELVHETLIQRTSPARTPASTQERR